MKSKKTLARSIFFALLFGWINSFGSEKAEIVERYSRIQVESEKVEGLYFFVRAEKTEVDQISILAVNLTKRHAGNVAFSIKYKSRIVYEKQTVIEWLPYGEARSQLLPTVIPVRTDGERRSVSLEEFGSSETPESDITITQLTANWK